MSGRLRELLAINRAIAGTLDYQELIRLVVERAAELCSAERCALLLADDEGTARVAAHRGLDEAAASAFAVPFDERIHVALSEHLEFAQNERFLGVPVIHRGQVTGMLVVQLESPVTHDAEAEPLLTALADQAAIALDHAGRYRALLDESRQARRELEAAARRKDEFLAMLAHELRNPLAAITNAVAVMRAVSPEDPRLSRVGEAAERQSQQMARLLDDLLDVSRVTRGKIALRWNRVVVQELIEQAVQSAEATMREHGHELHVEVPSEPIVIDGDFGRLLQVVSNLLSNASKYSEPGGTVWLSVTAHEEGLQIRVRDAGVGIQPELLPFIFDLFVQSAQDHARKPGGLGIGLTLARRLVDMHHGSIEAFSQGPGRGSEFVVHLPLKGRPQDPGEVQASAARPPAPAQEPAPPRHVLIVEDNQDAAGAIAAWLEIRGYSIDVAHDGEAALELARRRRPEIVLLDLGLPGMDGYELARRLRRESSAQPLLIAITGYGATEDRERSAEAGIDHHLVKPVDLEWLNLLMTSSTGAR